MPAARKRGFAGAALAAGLLVPLLAGVARRVVRGRDHGSLPGSGLDSKGSTHRVGDGVTLALDDERRGIVPAVDEAQTPSPRPAAPGHDAAAGTDHAPAHHLPAPSVWPAVVALGLTLLLFGVVTHPVFSIAGALVMARAIAGWIGELRDE